MAISVAQLALESFLGNEDGIRQDMLAPHWKEISDETLMSMGSVSLNRIKAVVFS